MKKYRLGFDLWALALFLIIMIPNFIWSAVPAPNDVLRMDSATGVLDAISSVFRVLSVAALCIFKNVEYEKRSGKSFIFCVFICCLIYFAGWAFYYAGAANKVVIMVLTLSPCLAFASFALHRKNWIAVVPISIFTVCHMITALLIL